MILKLLKITFKITSIVFLLLVGAIILLRVTPIPRRLPSWAEFRTLFQSGTPITDLKNGEIVNLNFEAHGCFTHDYTTAVIQRDGENFKLKLNSERRMYNERGYGKYESIPVCPALSAAELVLTAGETSQLDGYLNSLRHRKVFDWKGDCLTYNTKILITWNSTETAESYDSNCRRQVSNPFSSVIERLCSET